MSSRSVSDLQTQANRIRIFRSYFHNLKEISLANQTQSLCQKSLSSKTFIRFTDID